MYKLDLEKTEEPQIKVQTSIGSQGFPGSSVGKESACNAAFIGWGDLLEKKMTTHSSILAQKISMTEETGGLQSLRLQRVGHNLAIKPTPHSPMVAAQAYIECHYSA